MEFSASNVDFSCLSVPTL